MPPLRISSCVVAGSQSTCTSESRTELAINYQVLQHLGAKEVTEVPVDRRIVLQVQNYMTSNTRKARLRQQPVTCALLVIYIYATLSELLAWLFDVPLSCDFNSFLFLIPRYVVSMLMELADFPVLALRWALS